MKASQAGISFKPGEIEGYKRGFNDGKRAGIKEVAEWINKNIADPFPYAKEEWQSKLKEWGLG